MIYFVTARATAYTHQVIPQRVYPDFRVITYDQLFRRRKVRKGTWIFTDFDRLNIWDLELAGRMFKELQDAKDVRVLNNPARVSDRFALLRRLKANGVNSFNVWRLDELDKVERFPVFLRQGSLHRGPTSGLLKDRETLDKALEKASSIGYPISDLMIVEYAASELRPGLYRKLSIFRVGDRYVRTLCVHQGNWRAKYGEQGIAGQELYNDEYLNIKRNTLNEQIHKAFELAEIDYGRADYAIADGRIEVYEINTNPDVQPLREHPFAVRMAGDRLWLKNLGAAFAEIDDQPSKRSVRFADWRLKVQRQKDRFATRSRWVP